MTIVSRPENAPLGWTLAHGSSGHNKTRHPSLYLLLAIKETAQA
jgi:hypothetical protein